MKIAIIGAGNIGGALTHRLTALGHDVTVANSRGPQTLAELAEETGASTATREDAPRGAELVIVTIPQRHILDLPRDLLDQAAADVVVIDTGNYYPQQRDGRIDAIEDGTTESEWVAQQLRHPVIKVFNNIYAQHLLEQGLPKGQPGRIALPVAGDDASAKAVVLALVEELGFDAVDAGPLSESWRQQPGSPVYGTDFDADGVKRALDQASRERPSDFSASADA